MTERRFVYHDSDGVRREMISEDTDPDRFTVKTSLVLDRILESTKRMRESHPTRSTNKLVARVPMTVYEQSIVEQWDDADWKRWLNDPQNAPFRVWGGRV